MSGIGSGGAAMRVIAIVQARLGSTRLPRKVLAPISGEPMLSHVLRRVCQMGSLDEAPLLAVPYGEGDRLSDACRGYTVLEGDPEPLARYVQIANNEGLADSDYIVRLTGDCPGLDPKVSDMVVRLALDNNLPYAANVRDWPDGLDTECFTVGLLKETADVAPKMNHAEYHREHVTSFMRGCMAGGYLDLVRGEIVDPGGNTEPWELPLTPTRRDGTASLRDWKLSVDTESDLEYVRELYAGLGRDWGWQEAYHLLPGSVCPLCAEGLNHPYRSLTSIGGPGEYIVTDLHEINVSGGVGYSECTAHKIVEHRIKHHLDQPASPKP